MKKLWTLLLILTLVAGCLPGTSLAAAKQMRDGVPEWTEEAVKQYALDFIHGNDMERLYGYYDLQIRRYMPMDTYTAMLTEIEWMTGEFVALGSYRTFEEADRQTRTHVLHLCMEKQDLDLYFTHKTKADDWEIMAVEFIPGAKEETPGKDELLVSDGSDAAAVQGKAKYTEEAVQVGQAPYLLAGTLTLPEGADATHPVPGVVLVHDAGAHDRDETYGQTKLFADMAAAFAQKGVATLRYDKRTFTYGDTLTAEELANLTVEGEVIEDAISAGQVLREHAAIDPTRIVLLGHGLGASLAPRIASEADGLFTGMILLAGTPKIPLELTLSALQDTMDTLEGDAFTAAQERVTAIKDQLKALKRAKTAEAASALTVEGGNALYQWDMLQVNTLRLIAKLKLPTYIVQGNADFTLSLDDGIEAYEDELGNQYRFVEYKIFRKMNHLLMIYDGPSQAKGTTAEYDTPATLNKQAGRYLADWVLALGATDDEE